MKVVSVLQFGENKAGYLLPCVFAFGIYLSVLVMFANYALFHQIQQAIGHSSFPEVAQLPHDISRERLDSIITSLGDVKGVSETRVLREEELRILLQPWLSEEVVTELLPLPFLIEITRSQSSGLDRAQLHTVLNEIPGASLMALPGQARMGLSSSYGLLAALFIVLLAFTTVLVSAVIFVVTRMSLLLHKDTVNVMRLLGALDQFIIRQFQLNMFRIAVIAGLLGSLVAAGTVIAALYCANGFGIERFFLDELAGLFLALVVVGVGLAIMLSWLLVPKVVGRHLLFLQKPRW